MAWGAGHDVKCVLHELIQIMMVLVSASCLQPCSGCCFVRVDAAPQFAAGTTAGVTAPAAQIWAVVNKPLLPGTCQQLVQQNASCHADIQGVHQLLSAAAVLRCHLNLHQLGAAPLHRGSQPVPLVPCST